MTTTVNDKTQKLFSCPLCGLKYRDESTAIQCAAWCRVHNSCNIEIIKQAMSEDITQSDTVISTRE